MTQSTQISSAAPHPMAIQWRERLFTPENRRQAMEEPNGFASTIIEIAVNIRGGSAFKLRSISEQVLSILTPYLRGPDAALDGKTLVISLIQHASWFNQRRHDLSFWYIRRGLWSGYDVSSNESYVARQICETLIELHGMNTAHSFCGDRLSEQPGMEAFIAAAPIELIEQWIDVPSTCPSLNELRAMTNIARASVRSRAAKIYLRFHDLVKRMNTDTRASTSEYLRVYTQQFAAKVFHSNGYCALAMSETFQDLLLDEKLTEGELTTDAVAQVIGLQIIFLAFNGTKEVMPDCQLSPDAVAELQQDLPTLRKRFGTTIVLYHGII